MEIDFVENISSLTDEQRLHFYEIFAHNLTIAIRYFWSEPELNDAEKIDCIKWVNEILHRVTSIIYELRLKTSEWTEESIWEMIQNYLAMNDLIKTKVYTAIQYSFNSIVREKD